MGWLADAVGVGASTCGCAGVWGAVGIPLGVETVAGTVAGRINVALMRIPSVNGGTLNGVALARLAASDGAPALCNAVCVPGTGLPLISVMRNCGCGVNLLSTSVSTAPLGMGKAVCSVIGPKVVCT